VKDTQLLFCRRLQRAQRCSSSSFVLVDGGRGCIDMIKIGDGED